MLQLVADAELHNNLQYLGQARDQKITPELAQQLGQRLGVKAYLAGSGLDLEVYEPEHVNVHGGEFRYRFRCRARARGRNRGRGRFLENSGCDQPL